MEKIERRGRPLGSGNKSRVVLGIRASEEELEVIKEVLRKMRVKYKTKREVILYLFKKYNRFRIEE